MRTFSLGAGADTVVFSSTAADDANTITNFTVAGDKLEFSGTGTAWTGYDSTSATVETISSSTNAVKNKVYVTTDVANIKGGADTSAQSKVIIAIDSDDGNIYAVTTGSSSGAASTSVLIGSIDNWTGLTADNFVFS